MNRSPYTGTAILLHWLIALLILVNLGLGISFDYLAKESMGPVMGVHKSIGLLVLLLSLWRVGLRISAGFPALPAAMPEFERVLARGTHVVFYGLMLLLPLSGWVMSSAAGRGIRWFGLFDWPLLPVHGKAAAGAASETHEILAWILVATLLLHVAGALKHHFLDRDDVLARMLPFLRPRRP
jgi:cytochrome b561